MAAAKRKKAPDIALVDTTPPRSPTRRGAGLGRGPQFLAVPEPCSSPLARPLLDLSTRPRSTSALQDETDVPGDTLFTNAANGAQEAHLTVGTWTTSDVLKWLESRGLRKFTSVIEEYKISGQDIIENRLSVLNCGLTVEDREELLSEIYYLLHPEAERPDVNSDLRRASNAEEQAKYRVAVAVARCRDSRSASPTLVLLPRRSPSPRPRAPLLKQRSRSESGVDSDLSELPSPGRKFIKRRSGPTSPSGLQRKAAVRGIQAASSVFEVLTHLTPAWTRCVTVTRRSGGFPFELGPGRAAMPVVASVTCSDVTLQPGDIILEMNGFLLPKGDNPNRTLFLAEQIMQASKELELVVARVSEPGVSQGENVDPKKSQLELEEKWRRLRSLLIRMQEEDADTEPLPVPDVVSDLQTSTKQQQDLEEEVLQLQETLREQSSKMTQLQKTLEEATTRLHDVTKQRDVALAQLNRRSGFSSDASQDSQEESADNSTETIQTESGVDVEERAARRTLDRLVAVVVEHAPWLLDALRPGKSFSLQPGHAEAWC